MIRGWSLACAVVMGLAGVALAEQVDNPQYKAWASYKPGTFVTLKTASEISMGPRGSMKTETTITRKLVEVTAENAVVETSATSEVMGKKHEMPSSKQTIPAKVDKADADKAFMNDPSGRSKATVKDVKTGTDTVDVNGKPLATTTHEATVESDVRGRTMTSHVKSWVSNEVPGGLVKMTMTGEGDMKMDTTTTLTDYKVEK